MLKSRYKKVGICILIFLLLIGVSNLLLRPVYSSIITSVDSAISFLNQKIKDEIGISISYKNLSPSIFRGINISEISVADTKSGQNVVSVKKLSLLYSFWDLFKKKSFDNASSLVLRDIELQIREGENDFCIKKILKLLNANTKQSDALDFSKLQLSFINDLHIYRLAAVYKSKDFFVQSSIGKASFQNGAKGILNAIFSGNFFAKIGAHEISSDLDFSANIPTNLENSNAVIRFSNIKNGDYKIRHMGFLAEYKNKIFSAEMLPNSQNIFIRMLADTQSGDLQANVFLDNFSPSHFVQTSKKKSLANKIFLLDFSIEADATYNAKTNTFSYSSSGNIFAPKNIFSKNKNADDFNISYAANGDETRILIPNLLLSSEHCALRYTGDFNFKTLQPEGMFFVDNIELENGNVFQTEIFVEHLPKGFLLFSPQLNFANLTFTAAELNVIPFGNSWDFTFEVSDYSHPEEEKPGTLFLFGSFAPATGEFQTSISADTIFLDTIFLTYAFFAPKEMQPLIERASIFARPFVFTFDAFAAGEGADYAFSMPYAFFANTMRDDQMFVFAADGNQDNFRISNLEFAFAGQRLLMNADSINLSQNEGRIINGRLELNGIPYNFDGLFNKTWFRINSEYGFQLSGNTDVFENEAVFTGLFSILEFPLVWSGTQYSLTAESAFSYSVKNGLQVNIPHFEGRTLNSAYLEATLAFRANIDSYGIYFDDIAYSDKISTLAGSGNLLWIFSEETKDDDVTSSTNEKKSNFINKKFESANFVFALTNSSALENISFYGEISNPQKVPLGIENLVSGRFVKSLVVAANMNIQSLRSQHFVPFAQESDSINATAFVQGNLFNPIANISVSRATFTIKDTQLVLKAQAQLQEMIVQIFDVSVNFGKTQLSDLNAKFNLKNWRGDMEFALDTELFGKKINTTVTARAEPLSESEKKMPDVISFSFDTNAIFDKKTKRAQSYHMDFVKMYDELMISTSDNIGLNGSIINLRDVKFSLKNPLPIAFDIEGIIGHDELNLIVTNVNADLGGVLKALDIDIVNIYKGIITGGFAITGSPTHPYFAGMLDVIPAEFNFPAFFTRHATTQKISLIMNGSQFYTEPTRCLLHRSPVDVTVNVQMNRLAFESLDVHIQTVEKAFAPMNMNLNEIHIKGNFMANINLTLENDTINVSGELTAKDTNAEFGKTTPREIFGGLSKKQREEEKKRIVDVALNIKTLSRVQIAYTSFLRTVIVPGTQIDVAYFGEQNRLVLNGELPIRSGEISYLNTNFYIKEGKIYFSNSDEGFDPRITIRAETKTHDEDGFPITISLGVENQHLSELSPRLKANPAKSEREIMEILGTIITADSDNLASFALAGSDFALQTVFTRNLENALRDLLKFDIFSLRTLVVQNAVRQSFERQNVSNPAGNYFDGTTVYIGKYLGDSVFADAMLRMDYDENRMGDKYTLNGLSFRPEIGFELESPFAKIRWSLSPDFEDLVNLKFVQNTALTISWKFTF